jgi:23S rRNA (uracil1939-C5)-methyltransferase
VIELELTDLSYLGGAVGHVGEGLAVFATGGLPGERARVEIAERKRQYARGRVVEVLVAAPERVEPPCPYFGACGGCQWQHLEYAAQVRWKSEQVRRQLQRIGHFAAPPVRPTIPAPHPWNYRNQARFSLDVRGRLGFTHFQSRRLLPIDFCLIMQPEIVALMPRLQGALPGGHQVVVRYGAQTGQVMVAPRLDLPDLETGQPSYDERLLGRTYRVSAPSFFQVNTRVDPFERPIGEESPPLDRPRYPRADTWAT